MPKLFYYLKAQMCVDNFGPKSLYRYTEKKKLYFSEVKIRM